MSEDVNAAGLKKLREPFESHQINKLPKPYKKESEKGKCRECGGWHGLPAVHLDYVGHAALTDRLLEVDPEWTWEPVAFDEQGLPRFDANGGLWIRLTVCGVTRLGYGDAQGKRGGDAVKEAIGDALRNAGMRFGAALDLWHKGDLRDAQEQRGTEPDPEQVAAEAARAQANAARNELLALIKEIDVAPREAFDKFNHMFKDKGTLDDTTDAGAIRSLIKEYRELAGRS